MANILSMDTYQKEDTIVFDSPKTQSSYIKVIGVGGGGNNAVNHMFRQGITGVEFLVCNTDIKALNTSPVPNKILLGNGMGAGNKPAVARAAAEEKKDELREAISDNTKMLFIAACMGGGTGTGTAPVIARLAKEIELEDGYTKKILVVAIVTMPFHFEGRGRLKQALEGLDEIRKYADSVLVINNDKLLKKSMPLPAAYACADDVLLTAAKGISEIITVDSYINIDFEDVNTVMSGSGTALMGVGIGKGEQRAKDAIVMATTSELLNDNDITGAKDILLYISFSEKNVISTDELSEITDYITNLTGSDDTNVIWGEGTDDNLDDEIKITLIATGFEAKKNETRQDSHSEKVAPQPQPDHKDVTVTATTENKTDEGTIYQLDSPADTKTKERLPDVIEISNWDSVTPKSDDGMVLIQKEQPAVNVLSERSETLVQHSSMSEPVNVEADNMVQDDGMTLVSHSPSHLTPSLDTQVEVQPSVLRQEAASLSDELKSTAEQRIKRMHDLLRNHPMGAQIVENMSTEELTNDVVPMARPLAESDMPSTYLGQGGRIVKQNGYLENKAD